LGEYRFYRGCKGEIGQPLEAFLKLVAVKGETKKILSSVKSLEGYVKIDSENVAPAFVGLFTGHHVLEAK